MRKIKRFGQKQTNKNSDNRDNTGYLSQDCEKWSGL